MKMIQMIPMSMNQTVTENVNARKSLKKFESSFMHMNHRSLISFSKVYANAKISNKGYDTSQFISSFRKALVPIGNYSIISFSSSNSEHVRKMNKI